MTRLIRKKRGVSVVISTLLVLAITIVGAMSISNLMSTSLLTTVNDTPKQIIMANSMLLVGYDTRDGQTLSDITTLNNDSPSDGKLCTASCVGFPTAPPSGGGTEFIVLQLWNKNTVDVPIRNIQVNGVVHTWDLQTRFQNLDGSIYPGFPREGQFSIIHHSNAGLLIQNGTEIMAGDIEKRIIIKLSPQVEGKLPSQDIGLGEPLQILVKIGDELPAEYVILSGDTK
ncbi:MAG: conserved exported protein of unknown function [Nitrosopumilales archaeon]|nr:MAG: conserved exported protein of unknown function [Nitrosopumilales archaeon]